MVSGRDVDSEEVIENIDVGGPTMIRAAAKNHRSVAVVVKPESYDAVLAELEESGGDVSASTRHWLANEAFAHTARYDAAISSWFASAYEDFPEHMRSRLEKLMDLSYGENPHQRAALYAEVGARSHILSRVSKLHGQALSFNNVLDLDAAQRAARRLRRAGLRDRQAQQPLRRRGRRDALRGLRARLRLRPDVGLRRCDRVQRAGDGDARRAAQRAVHRGALRADLGRRARGPAAEGGDPDPRGRGAPRARARERT